MYEIAPVERPAGRDVLTARASLDAFADAYHRLIAAIERDHPSCTEIGLFAAAPAAAAVQLGRGAMRHVQPALVVHDRNPSGVFKPALTLNRRASSADRGRMAEASQIHRSL